MSGYIRPISPLLLPGSNSLSAILHMPLQIASSESPVVSLSASSVTSYWVTYEPDSLCATDRTYYVLPTDVYFFIDKKGMSLHNIRQQYLININDVSHYYVKA